MTQCDRCNVNLARGDGYAVWSDARSSVTKDFKIQWGIKVFGMQATAETGGMLLCESCADALFRKEIWQEATFNPITVNDDRDMREAKRAQLLANNYAIALCAKQAGLSAQQARTQAREIAKLWWENNAEALKKLKSQSLIVSQPMTNAKKHWWQFWK